MNAAAVAEAHFDLRRMDVDVYVLGRQLEHQHAGRIAARLGQAPGFAGLPNQKAAEALTKYIITDMYAKAAQGTATDEAVKWAEGELKKIYAA